MEDQGTATVEFARDTVLKIDIKAVTLNAFSARTAPRSMTSRAPTTLIFSLHCEKGTVTWEKAGYDPSTVFATVSDFDIDVTKSEFTCDSSLLTHHNLLPEPVLANSTDRAVEIISPDKATMPKF